MSKPNNLGKKEYTSDQYEKEYDKERPVRKSSQSKENKESCQYTIKSRSHIQSEGNTHRKEHQKPFKGILLEEKNYF